MSNKKFISPGAWFSMIYPSVWCESEDAEGVFLFYNPEEWTGNFRISAYKADEKAANGMQYGHENVLLELQENPQSKLVKVGTNECAYSKQTFQEDGNNYETHVWIVGIDNVAFECSFTVAKGGDVSIALDVITSLQVRKDGVKYPSEVIPVRIAEIYQINESYDLISQLLKEHLKYDFHGSEEDLVKLQELVDSGLIAPKKKNVWLALGIVTCVIVANTIEGIEWLTLIDGNREAPVIQYKGQQIIDPMKLAWSKVKNGQPCQLDQVFDMIGEVN